jgi:hypothetical protein
MNEPVLFSAKVPIMNWRLWTWKDVASATGVVIAIGALLFFLGFYPNRDNWGFGSDWSCSNPGKGGPVCVQGTPSSTNHP